MLTGGPAETHDVTPLPASERICTTHNIINNKTTHEESINKTIYESEQIADASLL